MELEFARTQCPAWPEDLVRLCAGAMTVYRTRYSDILVHDFVSLLWIIEGERYLRAHRGVCYVYHEHGAFRAYTGAPPESTFFRIKKFLLDLEGMFRLMRSNIERSDAALLADLGPRRLLMELRGRGRHVWAGSRS